MSQQKVLFISQEITPYVPATPLSTFCRQLPQTIQEKGYEARLFMPKYGVINERRNQLHEVIRLSGLNIIIDDTDHQLIIKVATLQNSRLQVYFIDNDDYFQRNTEGILETTSSTYDNDERAIFFVRGVAETVKKLRWDPVIIHCTGWITALAPLYIKRVYNDDPSFKKTKIVYSLTAGGPDQPLGDGLFKKVKQDGISDRQLSPIKNKVADTLALNKLAIDQSDAIVQTDENIAPEIIEYVQKSGKPFLPYPGEGEEAQRLIAEFYDSILPKSSTSK